MPNTIAPLAPPDRLSVIGTATAKVTLAWRDPGWGTRGFNIFRDGVHLAWVNTVRFTDHDIEPNTAYTYQVSSTSPNGDSARSTIQVTTGSGRDTRGDQYDSQGRVLVFEDDFSAGYLDPCRWVSYAGKFGSPPAREVAEYAHDSVLVDNGTLRLTASPTSPVNSAGQAIPGRYRTAMVASAIQGPNGVKNGGRRHHYLGSRGWFEGRFLVRAKMPNQRGFQPALWLRPLGACFLDRSAGRCDPGPESGEINIFEHIGPEPRVAHRPGHVSSWFQGNVRWLRSSSRSNTTDLRGESSGRLAKPSAWFDEFHTFEFLWAQDQMTWLVDGEVFHRVSQRESGWEVPASLKHRATHWCRGHPEGTAPFDQEFFLAMNLQLGHGADRPAPGAHDEMMIDWVRIYQ